MPVELLASNPLLGASVLATLMSGITLLVSVLMGIAIILDFYPRDAGLVSIVAGLSSFVYLAVKYPANQNHEGIISHMLSSQQFGLTLFGDITFFGTVWLLSILLIPVGIGIIGVTRNMWR